MFAEIPADKIRPGLIGLQQFFKDYVPTLSFSVKCVGLMEDDQMVGVVVYGGGRIFSLAVAEDQRDYGYGRRLFEYVLSETNGEVVTYVPINCHHSVAAFISWGCYFEGFFTSMGKKTRYYRLVHDHRRELETNDFYDDKLWEDTATLAEEALVMFNVGSLV